MARRPGQDKAPSRPGFHGFAPQRRGQAGFTTSPAGGARTPGREAFTRPEKGGMVHTMNDILLFLGVIVAWFLVVRFVFPKLGIRG